MKRRLKKGGEVISTSYWKRGDLDNENMVYGPINKITFQEVRLALGKMKSGKAMNASGVVIEMLVAAGDVGVQWMIDMQCHCTGRKGTE